MGHKKDLAKIALAALILASANPIQSQADEIPEVAGILLAAGCQAHGCGNTPPPKNEPAETASGNSNAYQTRGNIYQTSTYNGQPADTRGPATTGTSPNGSNMNNRDSFRSDSETSRNYDSSVGRGLRNH